MAEDFCSIGMSLNQELNLFVFTRLVGRYQIKDLPEEDKALINIQTNQKFSLKFDICYHHEKRHIS